MECFLWLKLLHHFSSRALLEECTSMHDLSKAGMTRYGSLTRSSFSILHQLPSYHFGKYACPSNFRAPTFLHASCCGGMCIASSLLFSCLIDPLMSRGRSCPCKQLHTMCEVESTSCRCSVDSDITFYTACSAFIA